MNYWSDDCIFCSIEKGQSVASIFYKDELVIGFMEIAPVNEGHCLIIPRVHASCMADLEEETARHMFAVCQKTAAALRRSGMECEGVNMFLADGEAASQTVFHVHMHVIPRYKGDRFKVDWGPSETMSREELDIAATRIRDAL